MRQKVDNWKERQLKKQKYKRLRVKAYPEMES